MGLNYDYITAVVVSHIIKCVGRVLLIKLKPERLFKTVMLPPVRDKNTKIIFLLKIMTQFRRKNIVEN